MTKLNALTTNSKGALAVLTAFLLCWNAATFANDATRAQERWSRQERPRIVSIVREACESVVSIQGEKQYDVGQKSYGQDAQYDVYNGMGTGVILDERGYILTNYHVVKGLLGRHVIL